jgi:hypothetical protein
MPPLRLTIIYTLTDPSNGEVFYVGRTDRPLAERLREHLRPTKKRQKTKKEKRLAKIVKAGQLPIITELRSFVRRDRQHQNQMEQSWIDQMGGTRLTNSIRAR